MVVVEVSRTRVEVHAGGHNHGLENRTAGTGPGSVGEVGANAAMVPQPQKEKKVRLHDVRKVDNGQS